MPENIETETVSNSYHSTPMLFDSLGGTQEVSAQVAAKDNFRATTAAQRAVNSWPMGCWRWVCARACVAMSVGNRVEHLEIIFATAKIGALAIPLDVKWKAIELAAVVSALEPGFIVLQEDCAAEFEKAKTLKNIHAVKSISLSPDLTYGGLLKGQSADEPAVVVDEDDPFAVLLTSGTTGFPKGCLATHRTFVFHCINNAVEKGLGAHDTAILSSPIYFNAGRSFTLGIIYFGGTMILHERFDAEEVLKTIEREIVSYVGAVPTMCERMRCVRIEKPTPRYAVWHPPAVKVHGCVGR
jgi:acyl-CoA synthetase (AMP-forming)/AMP-acid ligase II